MTRWAPFIERYGAGECRDRIFYDMVQEDARARPRPLTMLDIGCGKGFDTNVALQEAMARTADQYIGVEPDPDIGDGRLFHRSPSLSVRGGAGAVRLRPRGLRHHGAGAPAAAAGLLGQGLRRPGGRRRFLGPDRGRPPLVHPRLSLDGAFEGQRTLLEGILGRRGVERYENYPVYYRSNTPDQIAAYTGRFRSRECINFAPRRTADPAVPAVRPPSGQSVDRRTLRGRRPGTLLAVRIAK